MSRKGVIGLSSLIVVLIVLNGLFWITDTTYIYRALYHNFANIDDYKIFENKVIRAASSPLLLPKGYNYNSIVLPPTLINMLEETRSVAFLLIQDDSVRYERYWEGYDSLSLSNSFSMAKSIVSVLTGIALNEGFINSLDDPVCHYLPDFCQGKKSKITIRHLLTMSSGLRWKENYALPISHTAEAYYGVDLRKLIRELKVEHEPGTVFAYKSGDTQILGLVLATATGQLLSEYAEKKFWQPLGATRDALWSIDKKGGVEKAYCCFFSNARDFARLGLLYLHEGRWNGQQIIPKEYVRLSVTPHNIPDKNGIPVDYYGYQWWVMRHRGEEVFYARGILGQFIVVMPRQRVVMVRLGHKRGERTGHHFNLTYQMVDAALALYNAK